MRWAVRHPAGLLGIHLNFLREALGNVSGLPADSREERAALAAISTFRTSGSAYFQEQATRPQTIGYALLDSPVALAAWMLDHDTDSYYKISRVFTGGQPAGNLTRDHVLDNITLYWLTGTGASAARLYWEGGQAAAAANGQPRQEMKLPAGVTAVYRRSPRGLPAAPLDDRTPSGSLTTTRPPTSTSPTSSPDTPTAPSLATTGSTTARCTGSPIQRHPQRGCTGSKP
jgi:hypothetical protein